LWRLSAFLLRTMKVNSWATLLSIVGPVLGQASTLYSPVREYSGSTFFDRWSYYGDVDNTTWGNVTYVDQATAVASKLTFVNSAGNAIIQVDNTTTILPAPVVNRNSVRITTTDLYGLGSLIMIDALNIPYGCSVWPSFWTLGPQSTWPGSGEIDIIEAINGMDHNEYALHTNRGCFQANVTSQSGTTVGRDCSTRSGCLVAENKPASYGKSFKAAGGGVFALQLDVSGINIWFFSRPNVPAVIQQATTSSQMDISTWGLPTASYPNTACDIKKFFPPQEIILLTTLCGIWAGVPSIYGTTCPGSCVDDNVIGDGSNYINAYWEIVNIRTYLLAGDVISTTTSSTPSATGTITSTAQSKPSKTNTVATNSANILRSSIISWIFSILLLIISAIGLY